ncbi:MAG: serine hydrolase [Candidatus Aminicenantes bacterium]|nr:serine hydrolase [Candidatus Aminicenantes bacterium]
MGKFSGSVLIAQKGKVLVSHGYGMANHEHDIPNKPRTKFRTGYVTKQFTAAATLWLQERGMLKVDDP